MPQTPWDTLKYQKLAGRDTSLPASNGMLPAGAPVWLRADNAYHKGELVRLCAARSRTKRPVRRSRFTRVTAAVSRTRLLSALSSR